MDSGYLESKRNFVKRIWRIEPISVTIRVIDTTMAFSSKLFSPFFFIFEYLFPFGGKCNRIKLQSRQQFLKYGLFFKKKNVIER